MNLSEAIAQLVELAETDKERGDFMFSPYLTLFLIFTKMQRLLAKSLFLPHTSKDTVFPNFTNTVEAEDKRVQANAILVPHSSRLIFTQFTPENEYSQTEDGLLHISFDPNTGNINTIQLVVNGPQRSNFVYYPHEEKYVTQKTRLPKEEQTMPCDQAIAQLKQQLEQNGFTMSIYGPLMTGLQKLLTIEREAQQSTQA